MEILLNQMPIFFNVKPALYTLHYSVNWNHIKGCNFHHDAEQELAVGGYEYIDEREVRDDLETIYHSPKQVERARDQDIDNEV